MTYLIAAIAMTWVYVKSIHRLPSLSIGMFRSCKISLLTSVSHGPSAIAELLVIDTPTAYAAQA